MKTMEEKEEDKSRHKRWMQTTKALLGAVRKETCQPYSIPVVPDDLRKSNESAYMPKVVSIGPRYKGKKELLPMEEIKWRCVTSLLSRTFGQDTIETCLETVIDLDATVRASYVDVIALDRYELATTMVFDGCFLLELLICESKLDLEIPIPFNGISPGIEVKKMEYVVSDLMLLENQIPIFILEMLFVKLLGSSNQMREFIQNLALPLFGYAGKLMVKSTSHFLDVAYSYIEMGWMDNEIEDNEVPKQPQQLQKQPQQHLNRCATRLKAAGITILSMKNDDDINFKFWDAISETQRIINTQHRHYLNLYLIFLLPLSFFSNFFLFLLKHFQQQKQPNLTIIISLSLFLIIFSTVFTYGAIISITYSVFHGFFNRPVKFKEAIKSIYTSFFPLLATNIVTFFVTFFISLLIVLVVFLIIYLDHVDVTTYSYLNMLCYMVLMLVCVSLVTYLAVNMSFMHVIVVVESCWGFEPLRRSWKLVKGMRRMILLTYFLFGSFQILVSMSRYDNWVLIFMASPFLAMFSLNNIAIITVLYIYSKEKHGEVANEEFGNGAHLSLIP